MKTFLVFIYFITSLLATSQTKTINSRAGGLYIQGTINNFKEPVDYIYIIALDGADGIDSVPVVNDKYNIRIATEVTTLVTLYSKNPALPENIRPNYMLTLIVEPATVTVTSTDSFPNAKVSGSKAYHEFQLLEAKAAPYRKQLTMFFKGYANSKGASDKDGMEQFQGKIDSALEKMHINVYYKYIKAKPSSIIMAYAVNQYLSRLKENSPEKDVEEVNTMYNTLSVKEKNSYFGRRIKKKTDSYKINIGMMAPAFVQNDTSGIPVSLASYKGKYVLLDFWASWCGPCRQENPTLVKVFKVYKNSGFTILSVSLDRAGDKTKWINAIRNDGLTWTHVSDLQFWNNEVATMYKVHAIPQNFLIDPSGKIIGKGLRGDELEKKLKEILY